MSATNLAFKEYEKIEKDYEELSDREHFLLAPIIVDLSDNGGHIAFRTFEDAVNWASEELDTWRYIAVSSYPSQRHPFVSDIIAQQLSPAENILETSNAAIREELDAKEASTAIRRYLDAYAAFCCVHSKSTLGQMALTMERYRPMVLGMLAGATGCVRPEAGRGFSKTADIEAFTFGYAIALQFRASSRPETVSDKISNLETLIDSLSKRFAPSEESLNDLTKENEILQKQIMSLRASIEDINKNSQETINNFIEETKDEINKMKTSLENKEEQETLEEEFIEDIIEEDEAEELTVNDTRHHAVDYWLEMATMHSRKASQSLAWFVITGIFSMTIITMAIVGLQQTGFILRGYFDFVTLAVLTMPIFVSILLLGMLASTRIRNDHLADKAREKIALLETLSELEFEDEADKKRRSKILESIFEKN